MHGICLWRFRIYKEQVLHATVHMDEKTPHIHCVVIPLVKKLDKELTQNDIPSLRSNISMIRII